MPHLPTSRSPGGGELRNATLATCQPPSVENQHVTSRAVSHSTRELLTPSFDSARPTRCGALRISKSSGGYSFRVTILIPIIRSVFATLELMERGATSSPSLP